MSGILYLAWRYLAYHKLKTLILVFSITLIMFLPTGLKVLVSQSADALTSRAAATPLIVGAKGSPLELVLNSLYLESDTPATMRYAESQRVTESGLALAIPLYTRFQSRKNPIVGTTLDYLDFRDLQIITGRRMAMLGECVVGAQAAQALAVGPGDHVLSSPESVFDIAGVYPLKMRVVGVLAPADSPDDRAIFVDLKTAWIIEGLAHGHQNMNKPEAAAGVLRREDNVVIANASVVQYNEITADNADSFHFHGDPGTFPVTAVIAVPKDKKSAALLRGRYMAAEEAVQILRPLRIMEELLATILTVQSYVVAAVIIISLSTFATAILVFILSLRLRKREINTMHVIGGSRRHVMGIMAAEIVLVLTASILLAFAMTLLTHHYGSAAVRLLIA
jgi:putative ABC transport system permease protein